MNVAGLESVLVILLLAVAAVLLLRRLHLPPILGYLLVGLVAGPQALGWITPDATLDVLAETGLVFLLFMVGLEFSLPQLWALRGPVFGLGGVQVLLSTLSGLVVALWLGTPWAGALVAGGALAMSSTAIALKQMSEQMELHSRHGRLSLAILLFQDLAAIPMLALLPILAAGQMASLWLLLGQALLLAALAVALMLAAGHWLLRPLFHLIAAARSAEVFTLAALLVALAAAWSTHAMGLSLALGAFLAGMMLGETEYKEQIELELRPFRDLLMGLFFIAVGLKLDLAALPALWWQVLLVTAGLVLGKGGLIVVLVRLARHESGVALRTGLVLAQGGEFGLALLTLALQSGLLPAAQAQVLLAAVILSMLLAPLLIRVNGLLAKRLFTRTYLADRHSLTRSLGRSARHLEGHVVLCGFGRMGQGLAHFLRATGVDFVALDTDPALVKQAFEAGERVFYGDGTHRDILKAAGLRRARALVVTFDDGQVARRIVHLAHALAPGLPLLVRARDDSQMEALEQAGATRVVPEILESGLVLASHLLQALAVPESDIRLMVEQARQEHYRGLRSYFQGEAATRGAEPPTRRHSIELPPGARAVGRALSESLAMAGAVNVVCLRRAGVRHDRPAPDTALQAGDLLVLEGPPEELKRAEERLLTGP